METDQTLLDRPRDPSHVFMLKCVDLFFTFIERLALWAAISYAAERSGERALALLATFAAIMTGAWVTSVVEDVIWIFTSALTQAYSLERNENAFHKHLVRVAAVVVAFAIVITINVTIVVPAVHALQPSP